MTAINLSSKNIVKEIQQTAGLLLRSRVLAVVVCVIFFRPLRFFICTGINIVLSICIVTFFAIHFVTLFILLVFLLLLLFVLLLLWLSFLPVALIFCSTFCSQIVMTSLFAVLHVLFLDRTFGCFLTNRYYCRRTHCCYS